MNIRRRKRILASGKSPSLEAMKRVYTRALANGGVTQDFSTNVENIREMSRDLNYNILSDAKLVYVPASYGESRNYIPQGANIRNLLTFSEDFTNAIWLKTGITVNLNANLNPFGINKSYYLTDAIGSAQYHLAYNRAVVNGTTYTITHYIKKAAHDWIQFSANNAIFGSSLWVNFNLNTGLFGNAGSMGTWTATQIDNGYWKVVITATAIASLTGTIIRIQGVGNVNTASFQPAYIGTGVNICDVAAVQFEIGTISTPYQKQVAAGDGIVDFNFTRATRSSVTNKLGVIEDSCYNLSPYSEDFTNAAWTKTVITVSAAQDLNPITGVNNVCKVLANTTSNTSCRIFNVFPNVTGQVTLTGYVKAFQNVPFIHVAVLTAAGTPTTTLGACIDTSNGTITQGRLNGAPVTILPNTFSSSVVNGYIFFTLTWNNATNLVFVNNSVYLSSFNNTTQFTGAVGDGIYLWGLQLVQGAVARPYLRTTNRLNVPKLDYSLSLIEPSLLIEPQRTNLITFSEDFTNVIWVKSNATISVNSTTNPFGVNKSYYLTDNNTNSYHTIWISGISVTSGQAYSTSFYVKKADDSWIQFSAEATGFGNVWTNFNFDTGLFGNGGGVGTWTAKQLSNSFWLITVNMTAIITAVKIPAVIAGTNNTNSAVVTPTYIGTNRRVCDLVAIQVEAGANTTTYIPTTTVAVTRNAETSYVDLYNNALLNRNNWTLFWEGYLYEGGGTLASLCLSDTNTAAANTNQIGWIDSLQPFYNISNVRTNGGASTVKNTFNRFAIQQNNGLVGFFANGYKIWTNASVTPFDYRYLVMNSGGSTFTTDKIALFNRTLTDAECIDLTENPSITFSSFDSTWNTSNTSAGSSTSTQVKLPLVSTGTYAMSVDWGDGTTSGISIWNQAETTHTYAVTGTYQIKITGLCNGWSFAATGDRLKILSVEKWGSLKLGTTQTSYFDGCSNLVLSSVTDILDTSAVINWSNAFRNCTSLTTINNINSWNTISATNMTFAFYGCTNFNSNIGAWNVSNITNYSGMFYLCTNFNNGGSSNINNWIIKTGVAINMSSMFGLCNNFNQPLNNWNVSNVTNMSNMFDNAFGFNQDIGGWNVSNVTNFSLFMRAKTVATFSTVNLDAIYNGWSSRPVVAGITITFGTAKYTAASTAGRAILTGAPNNWVITDGGI